MNKRCALCVCLAVVIPLFFVGSWNAQSHDGPQSHGPQGTNTSAAVEVGDSTATFRDSRQKDLDRSVRELDGVIAELQRKVKEIPDLSPIVDLLGTIDDKKIAEAFQNTVDLGPRLREEVERLNDSLGNLTTEVSSVKKVLSDVDSEAKAVIEVLRHLNEKAHETVTTMLASRGVEDASKTGGSEPKSGVPSGEDRLLRTNVWFIAFVMFFVGATICAVINQVLWRFFSRWRRDTQITNCVRRVRAVTAELRRSNTQSQEFGKEGQ